MKKRTLEALGEANVSIAKVMTTPNASSLLDYYHAVGVAGFGNVEVAIEEKK